LKPKTKRLVDKIKDKLMKNPFIKESNSGLWIAAAVTGVLTAGAMAWLYLKRRATAPAEEEHVPDYLQPAPAKHKKTDINDLHTIVAH
jgi:hypothetical protein